MLDMLSGSMPSTQDILFVQSSVLQSLDIYRPVDVAKQLMKSGNFDVSSNAIRNLSKDKWGFLIHAPSKTAGVAVAARLPINPLIISIVFLVVRVRRTTCHSP